jgi:hypothetical protein
MRKRVFIVVAIFCLVIITVAFALPSTSACVMLIGFSGLETLSEGTRVQAQSTASERLQVLELQQQAKARITKTFGSPRVKPIVIFLKNPPAFFPFPLNEYGSTQFVGTRACVIIGPQGTNLNVVTHELMHAELYERVGMWRRLTMIPAWFDEGVAMQMDFRSEYNLKQPSNDLASVQTLRSNSQFNAGNDQQLTQHYAFAKAIVAKWLTKIGFSNLYSSLERIRAGEKLESVFEPK